MWAQHLIRITKTKRFHTSCASMEIMPLLILDAKRAGRKRQRAAIAGNLISTEVHDGHQAIRTGRAHGDVVDSLARGQGGACRGRPSGAAQRKLRAEIGGVLGDCHGHGVAASRVTGTGRDFVGHVRTNKLGRLVLGIGRSSQHDLECGGSGVDEAAEGIIKEALINERSHQFNPS